MTKKNKEIQNQRRQEKWGECERKRRKKILHLKHTGQPEKKPILKTTKMSNISLMGRIRVFIYKIILAIKRLSCLIGIHDWKLCSGREGDSMYACIRCWARSKKKWEKQGSEEYYRKKEDKLGITNPENWVTKDGEYYFKEKHIILTEEEIKRLKVILKSKK